VIRQRSAAEGVALPTQHGGGSGSLNATTRGCLAGSAVCFVNHTGQVFPCGYLPVVCGNVTSMDFQTIWRDSSVFARLRDVRQLTGKCGSCEFARVCSGCRARAYAAEGDFMGEEPYCNFVPSKLRNSDASKFKLSE
jgi:radical SAM protein with 4Fe4S-binding SPASM domain